MPKRATNKVARRATVRVTRVRVDKDTVGVKITPVRPVVKMKKPRR